MKHIWKITGGLVLALAFVGSFTLVSMILDRTPPIVYERARALSASVPRGGTINVEFQVFRERICPVDVKRWVVDAAGDRHSIPSYTVDLQRLAGRETYRRSVTIPLSTALGPAWYEVILDYSCNVFHRIGIPIRVVSPPIAFTIGPADG